MTKGGQDLAISRPAVEACYSCSEQYNANSSKAPTYSRCCHADVAPFKTSARAIASNITSLLSEPNPPKEKDPRLVLRRSISISSSSQESKTLARVSEFYSDESKACALAPELKALFVCEAQHTPTFLFDQSIFQNLDRSLTHILKILNLNKK